MKILLFCLTAIVLRVSAQTTPVPLGVRVTPASPGLEAPVIVTSKFTTDYPNSNPVWRKTGDYYAAEIVEAPTQLKKIVVYDSFGNLIATDKEVAAAAYPKALTTYFKKNSTGAKQVLWMREKANKNPEYYILQNSDTLKFDSNGKGQSNN